MKILSFALLSLLISNHVNAQQRLSLCLDRAFWFPFAFTEHHKPSGLYVDMIRDAMDRLDAKVALKPMDWKKCLKKAKAGRVDGVLGASYKPARAEGLNYPADATSAKKPKTRLTNVEYVIVNYLTSNYVFNNDINTLPQPVRVPRAYSIADDLRNEGVTVDDKSFKDDQGTLASLITAKQGSAVLLRSIAEHYLNHPIFRGKLKIQKTPYKSKPYFVAFSKKSKLTYENQLEIWDAIKAIREDQDLMESYIIKYQAIEDN
jgi:polar amino acid transport system substrate-binding protein